MSPTRPPAAQRAELVLPAGELVATLAFFEQVLGFRVEGIFPADAPRTAVLVGHGVRLRFEPRAGADPGHLRLSEEAVSPSARQSGDLRAPNGTRITLVPNDPPVPLANFEPSLVVSRASDSSAFGVGRAGMQYRDLIPGRLGGRYVASHIRIPAGGPVPDYVHFHRVHFQMIHCARGWVRVVYEDQGPPFVLEAGDGVLQPPGIRHRVLESSPGLEVVELGLPAEHETWADLELVLPTPTLRPERAFGGQRFAHYRAAEGLWAPWGCRGFEARDTGLGAATGGLADVHVVRRTTTFEATEWEATGELNFLFVLGGSLTLGLEGTQPLTLAPDDALVVPPHARVRCEHASPRASMLTVRTRAADPV